MYSRLRIFAAVAALVPAALAAAAPCDTVFTETRSYGPATPAFTQPLTFDQYTGIVGEVCSIKVELTLDVNGGFLGVDNDGADPATVSVQLGATSALSSMDVTLLDVGFQPVTGTAQAFTSDMFNLGGDNGDGPGNVDLTAPDGAVHLGGAASDAKSGFINPLFYGGFVGNGTYDINLNAQQILDFGSVGGVEGSFSPVNASGLVRVTMTVPEPATLSLLGLGALIFRRRRPR